MHKYIKKERDTMLSKNLRKCGCCLLAASFLFLSGCHATSNSTNDTTSTQKSTDAALSVTNTNVITASNKFEKQTEIDEMLKKELQNCPSIENPTVIINPYGNSPLSGVVLFQTDQSIGGTITVLGKDEKDNITGEIEKGTKHLVPIYGLYPNATTKIKITLEDGTEKTVEAVTEKIDMNINDISVSMKDKTQYNYDELTLVMGCTGALYALDSSGDVRWYFTDCGTLGVHKLANGHLMVPTKDTLKTSYYKSGLQEMDLTGRIYNEYAIPGGMHHDFQEMSNGNLLVASDSPDFSQVEDYVVEIDRNTGKVLWSLDMSDLIDESDGASASLELDGTSTEDWFHNNSIWYDEANDLLLLSARHKDAIFAVKKSTKELQWILGDPADWKQIDKKYFFTPKGDNFEWFYAQHQVTMLDNGDIMLFDNGTARVKPSQISQKKTGKDVYSRAVIYHIDTDTMTVSQVSEYGKERGASWYSDWISGVISLDGSKDRLWVTAGSNLYNKEKDSYDYGPSSMFQKGMQFTTHIDSIVNGKLVYEIKLSGSTASSLTFRSLRLPFYEKTTKLDLETTPKLLGSLGQTKTSDQEIKIENEQTLDTNGWTFVNDTTKLTISGTYQTQKASDQLGDGFIILKNKDQQLVYSLNQTYTKQDDKGSVSVSGWVSTEGLTNQSYDLYLMLDGTIYNTGYSIQF